MPAFLQPGSELAGSGGLAGALQAGHQHYAGWLAGKFQLGGIFAQDLDQLVADDLYYLLGGRERGHHLGAQRLSLHLLGELLHHLDVDVSFQQRQADLAHGLADIFFAERALAAQVLESALKFI